MEGPSQAKIECDDKGDGSCDVRYWPTEPGEYAVHVLCNNEDIQHSPFMAEIVTPPGKDFYPDKVSAHAGTRALPCCAAAKHTYNFNVMNVLISRLRRMVQAFRTVGWQLESPLSSQSMPSKEETLL